MPIYKIVNNGKGMGGLMCPPGHWNHAYVVERYGSAQSREPSSIFSLDHAKDQDIRFPANIMNQAHKIMDEATLIQSENWVRNVYGYFRNMYVPESGSRSVDKLINSNTPIPGLVHAATAWIRDFFPDHQPRMDLIMNPGRGYGSWPCIKCGQRVQYAPKLDAHAVFGMDESGADCPRGGKHHVED